MAIGLATRTGIVRVALAGLFMGAVVSTPVYARGDLTAFADVRPECAGVADLERRMAKACFFGAP